MASMKGIEVKALKEFRGHEGEPLWQGNIYMDGKKVGYYSDDAHGGMAIVDIYPREYREEFEKRTKDYTEKCTFNGVTLELKGEEHFMSALVDLLLTEKRYKTGAKKGKDVLMDFIDKNYGMVESYLAIPAHMLGAAKEKYKDKDTKVYTSLDDFVLN